MKEDAAEDTSDMEEISKNSTTSEGMQQAVDSCNNVFTSPLSDENPVKDDERSCRRWAGAGAGKDHERERGSLASIVLLFLMVVLSYMIYIIYFISTK